MSLKFNGKSITFPDNTEQITAWTGNIDSSQINDFNSAVSGLLPPSNFTSLSGISGIVVTNSGTNYFVSLSDPTIQLNDITDLSSDARTFLLTPSSNNLQSLISDETGSGLLVFNTSPNFSGIPTVPTATSGTNNTQIANTAFVRNEIANLIDSAPTTLDTLNELAAALGDDPNFATTIASGLANKAPLVHTHVVNDITDFSSGVSGLLPTISNSGNNRILTSTGSSVGINAENNLTFDGSILNVSGQIISKNINLDDGPHDAAFYIANTKANLDFEGYNVISFDDSSIYLNGFVSGVNSVFNSGNFINGLTVNNVPVSISGHIHDYNDIVNWASGIENEVSTLLVAGNYININYNDETDTLTISATGLQPSGNYANAVHSHGNISNSGTIGSTSGLLVITTNNGALTTTSGINSNYITNFNSSVSGLFPSDIATGVGVSGYLTKWNGINTISTGIMYDNGTNIGIGTTDPSALLHVSGTVLANTFTTTSANNINIGSGQIYLNGLTGNRIDFNASGVGPPTFTNSRSSGTKIVLSPNTSSTQTEYALGIEAGAMWFSIPVVASRAFQWYAGTANIATLFGNGTLDIKGNTSRINVDDLRLDDNVISTTASNSNLILMPNGNGALLADTSGNLRGIYSNDFQRERTSVSGVASGGYSVICGGSDNRTANSYSIVCGGQSNTASNAWSVVCGGDLNNATGNRSVICGGGSNTSSAASSSIGGGSNNQAIAPYAIVPGGFRGKATRIGELSHAAGMFNNTGDAQHTILIARRLTTDATANVVLTLNGAAPAETNILSISAQTMWTFSIKLSAYNLTNNQAAWWIFRGGIRRNNANSTVLVGSLITESGAESTLSTASATVVANDTDEALEIRVTGVAAKNIRWVAVADISQVSYGVV